jgi:hypothetical protein
LLALRRNRTPAAWWVWLALAGSFCVQGVFRSGLNPMPSQQIDVFAQTIGALTFGLAAVWLVSGYLGWKHRFLAFLGVFGLLVGVALPTFILEQGFELTGSINQSVQLLESCTLGAFGSLIMAVTLTVTGWLCRGVYHWRKLPLCLTASVLAVSALVLAPFFIFAIIASRGSVSAADFLAPWLLVAGVVLATLLPFLVLSLVNGFYRERLKGLLRLGAPGIPPLIREQPVAAAVLAGVSLNNIDMPDPAV